MIYAGDRGVGDVDSDSDGRSYGPGHDHACFQSNHDGCGRTQFCRQEKPLFRLGWDVD